MSQEVPRHQHMTKKGPQDTNISLKSVPQTPQSARKTGSTRPARSKKIPDPPYQPDPARPIKPTRPTIDKTLYANPGTAECAKRLNNDVYLLWPPKGTQGKPRAVKVQQTSIKCERLWAPKITKITPRPLKDDPKST